MAEADLVSPPSARPGHKSNAVVAWGVVTVRSQSATCASSMPGGYAVARLILNR
jgi:hypothetical protein